jgi:hypothetical protein
VHTSGPFHRIPLAASRSSLTIRTAGGVDNVATFRT